MGRRPTTPGCSLGSGSTASLRSTRAGDGLPGQLPYQSASRPHPVACEHREKMRGLFRPVKTAVEAGLVNLVLQAVDGTRISGNASKDRTLDAKGLRRLLKGVEESMPVGSWQRPE